MSRTEVIVSYRCRVCKRFFYVEFGDKTAFDIQFGCPYGCDDNGQRMEELELHNVSIKGRGPEKICLR